MTDRDTVRYLMPAAGRWAIGRMIDGRAVFLVENTPVDDDEVVDIVLAHLAIATTDEMRDRYFPCKLRRRTRIHDDHCIYEHGHMRCATLELLEMFSRIGRTRCLGPLVGV